MQPQKPHALGGAPLRRRDFLAALGLGAAAMVTTSRAEGGSASVAIPTASPEASRRPNIICVLADDMGYGDVRALHPASKIPTPHLDRLVGEGMNFTDAHSGSAVCTPTRYGLLTGRYCWRSRLKRGVLMGFDRALIEDGRPTVASLLRDGGYATACLGKWHLGMDFPTTDGKPANPKNVDWTGRIKRSPLANGFDHYYGISASLDMPPYIWIDGDRFVGKATATKAFFRKGPAEPAFEAVDVLPELGRRAVSYIEGRAKEKAPFFLYLPLNAPHTPIVPAKPFQGKSGIGSYGDFCVQVDAIVGDICAALERTGLAKDTLLIFTTDNGCSPAAGTPKLEKLGHFPSAGRRGYKADVFEGGHRVPFIARWPGRVAPGSSYDQTVCLTDLLATCADIVGIPVPDNAGEDSVSLRPALLGETQAPVREATVHHSIDGSFAIRKGKWKLEECPGSGGWSAPKPKSKAEKGLPPIQLYDMAADPAETTNVWDKHPDVVTELSALLKRYKEEGRSVPKRTK